MRARKSLVVGTCGVVILLSSARVLVFSTDARPCAGDPVDLAAGLIAADPETRRQAAIALRYCSPLPDAAFEALIGALDDTSFAVAANAADALIPAGARAVAPLVDRVRTKSGEDRQLAIRTLRRLGESGRPAVDALLDELRNRRSGEGKDLVLAIRDLDGNEARAAVPLFVKLLDDPDLKNEAASVVARLSGSHPDRVIPVLVQALREQTRGDCSHPTAHEDLARYGELAIPAWLELLSDRSVSTSFGLRALEALGPDALKRAIPQLHAMLKESWRGPLDATGYLLDLAAIGPDDAAEIYRGFLSHEYERWRLDAVAGLLRVDRASDPRIEEVLKALVDDRQEDVRERARSLLGQLGN